jgi:isocitrate lyase
VDAEWSATPTGHGVIGAGYFDDVMTTVTGGKASTLAFAGSTEEAQFDSVH